MYESETQGITDPFADPLEHGVCVITVPWLCYNKRICFLKNDCATPQLAVSVCAALRGNSLSTECNCRSRVKRQRCNSSNELRIGGTTGARNKRTEGE